MAAVLPSRRPARARIQSALPSRLFPPRSHGAVLKRGEGQTLESLRRGVIQVGTGRGGRPGPGSLARRPGPGRPGVRGRVGPRRSRSPASTSRTRRRAAAAGVSNPATSPHIAARQNRDTATPFGSQASLLMTTPTRPFSASSVRSWLRLPALCHRVIAPRPRARRLCSVQGPPRQRGCASNTDGMMFVPGPCTTRRSLRARPLLSRSSSAPRARLAREPLHAHGLGAGTRISPSRGRHERAKRATKCGEPMCVDPPSQLSRKGFSLFWNCGSLLL